MFSTKELFGYQLLEIWSNPAFACSTYLELRERGFAIQDIINKEAILFVGINPSMAKSASIGNTFYEKEFLHQHPYFKPFSDIALEVGEEWSHIDLLFVRETSQQTIKNLCQQNANFRAFAAKQYSVAIEIIKRAKPKVIVVNNTLAREFIKGYCGVEGLPLTFDNQIGTYRINSGELAHTPLFFTSMLSGQRALDNGSKERLIWQIKLALRS